MFNKNLVKLDPFLPLLQPLHPESSWFLNQKGLNLNEEALEGIILGHIDSLHAFAKVLTGSMEGADDLVQETYLKATQNQHHYKSGTNCKAWLFTVMKNLFLNTYRQRKREVPLGSFFLDGDGSNAGNEEDLIFVSISSNPTPDLKIDLERAFASLPADLRLVVMLRDQEGLEYREIADLFSCPVGTVMSRLSRGRARIKNFLLEK